MSTEPRHITPTRIHYLVCQCQNEAAKYISISVERRRRMNIMNTANLQKHRYRFQVDATNPIVGYKHSPPTQIGIHRNVATLYQASKNLRVMNFELDTEQTIPRNQSSLPNAATTRHQSQLFCKKHSSSKKLLPLHIILICIISSNTNDKKITLKSFHYCEKLRSQN